MKKLKILSVVLILFVTASLAFAGGQGEKAKAATPKKVTISFWHFPIFINVPGFEGVSKEYGDWEKFLAKEFMKTHPNIEVKTQLQPWEGGVDKINVAIAGGNPPEVVADYLGRTGGWFVQGAAVPLDNLLPASLKNDILPAYKSLYYINGKLHAMPIMAWSIALVINGNLTDKYGLTSAIPKMGGDWSTDEFVSVLKKMKAAASGDGIYPLGLACGSEQGDYIWWRFVWGFGGGLFDKDGNVIADSPKTIEAYKYLLSINKQGLMVPGVASITGADVMKLWSSEKEFMQGGNAYYRTLLEKAYKDGLVKKPPKVIAVNFPAKPGEKQKSAIGPTGYVIMTKDSAKQKAAAAFIEFAMQTKYNAPAVKSAGQFPATKSAADLNIYKDDKLMTAMANMLAKYPAGDFGLSNPNYGKIRVALAAAEQAMFSGIKTPEQAMKEFADKVKTLIKK